MRRPARHGPPDDAGYKSDQDGCSQTPSKTPKMHPSCLIIDLHTSTARITLCQTTIMGNVHFLLASTYSAMGPPVSGAAQRVHGGRARVLSRSAGGDPNGPPGSTSGSHVRPFHKFSCGYSAVGDRLPGNRRGTHGSWLMTLPQKICFDGALSEDPR